PKSKEKIYFINENNPVKLTVFKDSLNSSLIKGKEADTLLQEYTHKINDGERELRRMKSQYSEKELNKYRIRKQLKIKQAELDNRNTVYRKEFLHQHPDHIVSLLVYADLIKTQTVGLTEMRRIYNTLSPELRETGFGKQLGKDYVNSDPLGVGN